MSREAHVRFWESAEAKFPRATHLLLAPIYETLNLCTYNSGNAISKLSRLISSYLPVGTYSCAHVQRSSQIAW